MKTKFIHVGKRTLSVVLSIMMIVSTMLIGTITSVSAYNISNGTFYFVKPDGWTNAPRLSIGSKSSRMMMASTGNIDNKIYIFSGINFDDYDGYFFADVSWSCSKETGDYYSSNGWKVANSTDKITGNSSGYLYKLNSGTSGAVTGTNDLNDNISAKVYLKSGDTFTENSSIASASASGKKIDNTTSTTEAAKYSSPTFKTTANDSSSYSFVGWYDSTNTNLVSENATYTLTELTTDTELHAVYEATTSGFDLMTTASAESTKADGSKIGTFAVDGTLTFSPTSNGTYYLYVDNGEQWFNNAKQFTNNSVDLYDYGTNNYKDTIKFDYEAGKTYTFTWTPNKDNDKKGTLSYTVSSTPVTSYKITASAYDSTKGTVTVDSSTLAPSGQTTTSNNSISIAVTPTTGNEIQSLSIGGNAITLTETQKTSGYTNSSYSISGDTQIEVVFAASSQPVGNAPVLHKYDTVDGSGSIVAAGKPDKLNANMTYYSDSKYAYYYYQIENGGRYLYNITLNNTTYYQAVTTTYDNSIDITNWSGWNDVFATGNGYDNYYIIYTPSLDVAKRISVVTELPNSSASKTYKVTMEQGITSRRDGAQLGSSYLDGVTTQTTVAKSVDELTVTFTTQTVNVENTTYNDLELGYTGYMYQVYGYSINMTLNDGTTRVASVVNSLVDSNSAKPISALANGIYTCEYTFPSNISSATVTPIFSVSADYAKAKGISYTAVYLKMTPGSNLLGNATEPKYYTWRAKANGDDDPTPYLVGDKNLEREPEGAYGGQKMLYIGNDMYVAYVQSDLYGILFDNGTPQTFDFNEFIKLQKLGYNNITFEPKSSTQSVASTLHNSYNANGVRKYEDSAQQTVEITPDNVNTEFELDVDIEGYYIDVFGNKLIDTNGNAIKRSDFVATLSDTSVSGELSALREKTGASTEIYGARYGSYERPDSDYGMRYSVYNYYVSGGTTKKLISQQVSGYGTIEGAMSPKNSSKTNAAYQASLLNPDYLTYFDDSTNPTSKKNFTTGYELIPETYKGVPYLVSYKTTSDNRTDGKWYYMNTTPQVTVNVKTSLLNIDGSLNMSSAGKIVENTTPGTATVNYKSFDTIDQGTSAVMRATPNEGFAFVGFYEENGDFISKYNPYGNKVFAVDTTVYAVFKAVANGTITITNNIYDSAKPNPTPGGGNGKVSVTLVITPKTGVDQYNEPVYGTTETYSGETSVSATINDGDKFHIILTGKRSGADNFLAFRMPDKDIDGNIYYVALDDAEFLNVTKDTNDKAISATYETADMVWDWNEQLGTGGTSNTLQAKTFNYYTDFSKTDINATLEYRYKDRFGNWKTYIVKNVPMDVSQINEGNYVPDNTLVLQYAPPIDEVFNSCSWKATDIDARNSYALLEADQTYKTFNTYVDRNADGKYSLDEKIVAPFNESIQIEAPETKGSATFKYWKRYLLDSTGAKSDSGEIFSNMRSISIKVTFDSAFEPVYDAVSDTYFTNVQDAKYTREKSTDDKGFVYDYVYADFLLQFDTLEGNDTFKNIVAKNGNIKFGVILEMDYNYLYDGNTITTPKTEENLLKQTITQLNTGLAEGGHNSGWNATTDSQLAQYNYYYNLYDLTDKASNLSNFGRYDYFFKFDNSEANRARVYNVYSYIIYTDSDSNEQIVVSKPKTLSIYATGIKNDGETA